ncbi:MAG TPA: hypothetical protein VMF65_04650, partial [Acidimicrobiales bacterium]|nr:hypothetical protein [Acidimicrobiales bacterium]
MRGATGVLTAFVLWAGALTMVVPAATVQAAATPQAAATTACSGFQDDFAADYPGSLNTTLWDQDGPVAGAVAQQLGAPLVAPGQASLTNTGWRSQSGGFSVLQSTGTCSGPFTFSTVFEADAGLNHFDVSLASADLSQDITVEGNTQGPDAGIWAGNSLSPAGTSGAYQLDATLCHHLVYAITVSVDASGSATVTLSNYYDQEILGTAPAIPVGTGPLYVLLGQGPGTIIWGTASVIAAPQPCSIEDDFGADTGLSTFWTDGTSSPESALTSVAATIGANFQTASTDFRFTQPPGPGMHLGDRQGQNGFTAVQSVDACAAPFTFSATVTGGANPAGSSFDIDFVSQDLTQVLSVQGNLGPANRSDYGIWAGDTLTPVGADDVVPHPVSNATYTVTVSVDGAGTATVTVSAPSGSTPSGPSSSGAVLGSVSGLDVGSDPLYVLLGQQGENGHQPCPWSPLWEEASLSSSPSAASGSVTASISAANPTVAAVETVPAGAVPASAVVAGGPGGTDPSSAPLSSISLSSAPLSSIPLSSIPLSSIALGTGSPGTAIAAAANTLGNIPLSELTITYPPACVGDACTGWQGIIAGTSLSGLPLQSITLGQVLANTVAGSRFDGTGMVVGDLGLSSSPLSSIPLSSIPLSSIPLTSIPLPGTPVSSGSSPTETDVLTTWCTALSGLGESCPNLGIDPSNPSTASSVTLLTLALAGVPLSSIPLSSIPLSSIPLSSIPLSSIPLSSIPLSSSPLSSIPLSSIPLSSIPLSSIPLSSIGDLATVVNCSGTFDCNGQTLGAAATANALEAGATLGDVVSGLANPSGTAGYEDTTLADVLVGDDTGVTGYPDLTLGDLLISLVPPQSYPWQSVDLAGVPLAQDESAGGSDQYTVP